MGSNAKPITKDDVLNVLRTVMDPDLKRDLVSLNMIQDLRVSPEGDVSVRVVLTTPACPMKARIEGEVRAAIGRLPDVRSIDIKMDAAVRRAAAPQAAPIEGVANIIAVSSGKGGVGKSTVAVNLACSLALDGARVGLMDADIYGPNLPTMMGIKEQPSVDEHPEQGEFFVPPEAHGVKVISMGILVEADQPMIWRGPMLHNVITQFCRRVRWGQLDYLVIDMPPGTGDVQLSLSQLVPVTGAVLVTTPQEVSAQDVRKALKMFEKVRTPVLGVVENMSYFVCGQCGTKHHLFGSEGGKLLSERFCVDLLAQIPLVPAVREGGDEGAPIVIRDRDSEVAQAFRNLARRIAQKVALLSA